MIEIDGKQVFISPAYEWKLPNNCSFYEVYAGDFYNDKTFKATIKNVKITSYE